MEIMVETLSEHLIVFRSKEKRYLFGLGMSTGHNSVTVVPLRMSNHTLIAHTAWLPTLFPFFCSTYSGTKCSPYRVILDRLSGQCRAIWTGLGCWGLASCMITVTCRVINNLRGVCERSKTKCYSNRTMTIRYYSICGQDCFVLHAVISTA